MVVVYFLNQLTRKTLQLFTFLAVTLKSLQTKCSNAKIPVYTKKLWIRACAKALVKKLGI